MKNIKLNLRLLDGGAEGGVASTGEGSNTSQTEEKPVVLYGKQDEAEGNDGNDQSAQGQGSKDSGADDLNKEFEDLIKGKFKDVYSQRVQDTISQRFKNQKDLSAQIDSYNSALAPLFDHYGVDAGDIDSLTEAIKDDDALYEEEAADRGLSVDDLRYIKELEAEQERNARLQEQMEAEQQSQAQYNAWMDEAKGLEADYPGFDLREEVQNEDFLQLLDLGWKMEDAYKAIHADDLLANAVGTAHHAAQKAVTDNIRARGMRPAENGLGAKAGVVIKDDPSKYTDDDIKEIIARVQRGEKIRL